MSIAITPVPRNQRADAPDRSVDPAVITWDTSTTGRRWPVWAIAAGATGLAGNLLGMGQTVAQDDPDPVVVVETLSRGRYHAAFVLGLVTAAGLVAVATGLREWSARRAPNRFAAAVMPNALMITAALAVIAASMAGALALYLPGGADHGTMWTEGLMSNYFYLDFGALIGWWGAVFAAACSLPLAFGDRRVLPRWLGIVTAPLVAVPVVTAAATGLPGLPGLTMPLWLAALGIALIRRTH